MRAEAAAAQAQSAADALRSQLHAERIARLEAGQAFVAELPQRANQFRDAARAAAALVEEDVAALTAAAESLGATDYAL
mgnify:CR=1 FL=1|jgi:hypothetical protein